MIFPKLYQTGENFANAVYSGVFGYIGGSVLVKIFPSLAISHVGFTLPPNTFPLEHCVTRLSNCNTGANVAVFDFPSCEKRWFVSFYKIRLVLLFSGSKK